MHVKYPYISHFGKLSSETGALAGKIISSSTYCLLILVTLFALIWIYVHDYFFQRFDQIEVLVHWIQ